MNQPDNGSRADTPTLPTPAAAAAAAATAGSAAIRPRRGPSIPVGAGRSPTPCRTPALACLSESRAESPLNLRSGPCGRAVERPGSPGRQSGRRLALGGRGSTGHCCRVFAGSTEAYPGGSEDSEGGMRTSRRPSRPAAGAMDGAALAHGTGARLEPGLVRRSPWPVYSELVSTPGPSPRHVRFHSGRQATTGSQWYLEHPSLSACLLRLNCHGPVMSRAGTSESGFLDHAAGETGPRIVYRQH